MDLKSEGIDWLPILCVLDNTATPAGEGIFHRACGHAIVLSGERPKGCACASTFGFSNGNNIDFDNADHPRFCSPAQAPAAEEHTMVAQCDLSCMPCILCCSSVTTQFLLFFLPATLILSTFTDGPASP